MALNINSGCYCCNPSTLAKMDIDLALDELGILSSVVESHNRNLQERMRTRSESALTIKPRFQPTYSLPPSTSTSCYRIVHIDKKYVTGFTDISSQTSDVNPTTTSQTFPQAVDNYKQYRTPTENLDSTADHTRSLRLKYKREDINARNRRILARKHAQQPYEVPGRLSWSFQESLLSCQGDIPEPKSNSSSPIKPICPISLPRSRSLDNLDFSTFFISKTGEKADIDKVAFGLKNLNVSNS